MDESTETAAPAAPPVPAPAEELARALGVSLDTAERLVKAGHTTVPAARELSTEALTELGISPEEAARLRGPVAEPGPTPKEEPNPERTTEAAPEATPAVTPEPESESTPAPPD